MKLHFKRLYGDDSFVINEDKTIIIKLDGEKYPDFNVPLETLALIENIVELHLSNCKHISGHRVSRVGPVRKERVGVGSWHGGGVGLSCTCRCHRRVASEQHHHYSFPPVNMHVV